MTKMRRRCLTAATLAACLAPASRAVAQTPGRPMMVFSPAGYHTHDGGFIRLTPGFGGGGMSASENGLKVTLSGGGMSGGIALGTAVAPNLVVCGEVTNLMSSGVTLTLSDGSREESNEDSDATLHLQYLGVGGSYYTPANFYLHGGLGVLWMGAQGNDSDDVEWTDMGVAARMAIGKEWWVSADVGVGLAAQLVLGSVSDSKADGGETDWTTALVGLQLSATYN